MPMVPATSKVQVVIVGAGIAGLTAAYLFNRHGITTRVIEATDRVGGRMTSDVIDGHVADRGAQFLSTEYRLILDMLRKLDISQQICETSQCSAVVRNGVPRSMRVDHPLDALKLFGIRAMLKLAWETLSLKKTQKELSLSDYSQWAEFDIESTASWSNRDIDAEITEYMYDPMLQGFYFQTPEETSKALAVALTAFGIRRAKTFSLKEGLGILPEMLARELDVMLNTTVRSIELIDGKAHVHTASETLLADHIIVAVPAPVAKNLIKHPSDDLMKSLLSTPYSASINVACITGVNFKLPKNLESVYGLLIPRKERVAVAAVGIENNKNRTGDVVGQLLNIMFSHDAAVQLMHSSDEDVVASAVQSVIDYFPSLPAHIANSRVFRWPTAEPLSPVGRSAQLDKYRKCCENKLPVVVLAGDYMSMPFTEGASESGYWAATMITQASNISFQRTAYGSR